MKRLERMESSGDHAKPEIIEQTQESKKEIENRVAKIFKLIKYNDHDKKGKVLEDSKRRSELIGLVEDFHKQYQSLHSQYDNLRREMEKQACSRKEKESSSSSSSSDLDYYSSEEIDGEHLSTKHEVDYSTENIFRMDEQKSEPEAPIEVDKVPESRASPREEELERKLHLLTAELEPLRRVKNELGAQIEEKSAEARQLGDQNTLLQRRIAELESVLHERGDEISSVLKKYQDNENTLKSRIEELTAMVGNLQQELEAVCLQKSNIEETTSAHIKGTKDRIKAMQQKMYSVRTQKKELELQLDQRTKQVAESTTQIETLKDEIKRKTIYEQEWVKMRESSLMQVEELEQRVELLCDEKNKLEEMVTSQSQEIEQLREENDRFQARVFELEDVLTDGGDEFYTFQKKTEGKESEYSTQVIALETQVDCLQQELDSLRSENINLKRSFDRLKQDSVRSRSELENEVRDLTNKVAHQQRILKEREDAAKKSTNDHKLTKHRSMEIPRSQSFDSLSLNNQHLKRKIEELAGKSEMKMENHIRLLHQRILVAEQMHVETKESYRKLKERVEQESKASSGKVVLCEAEIRQISDLLMEPGIDVITGMDSAAITPADDGNLLSRISRILSELQFAKDWIAATNIETNKLKDHVDILTTQLEDKEDKEMLLKKKIWKLEAKLSKEGGDKLNLVGQLERKVGDLIQQLKEKNESLASLGEEKREAIRQLCFQIDYHRNRYDDLKRTMSKMRFRIKRPT